MLLEREGKVEQHLLLVHRLRSFPGGSSGRRGRDRRQGRAERTRGRGEETGLRARGSGSGRRGAEGVLDSPGTQSGEIQQG